jgi:O-methyltransferase
MSPRDVFPVLERALSLSMATEADLRFTAEQALDVIERGVPGVFVECGVWRGGCAAAMLLAQRQQHGGVVRKTYLLDSFEGLPPATERDGEVALAWQADTTGPSYHDNCRVSVDEVRAAMEALAFPAESWTLVQGWFDETVPPLAQELREQRIALLRLDGDWYDSTAVCLEHLVPVVPEGGVVILDDYYVFDGCTRATHDFLSHHDLPYRICPVPGGVGAYFVKQSHRAAAQPA